jgi:hypothetical protein
VTVTFAGRKPLITRITIERRVEDTHTFYHGVWYGRVFIVMRTIAPIANTLNSYATVDSNALAVAIIYISFYYFIFLHHLLWVCNYPVSSAQSAEAVNKKPTTIAQNTDKSA